MKKWRKVKFNLSFHFFYEKCLNDLDHATVYFPIGHSRHELESPYSTL